MLNKKRISKTIVRQQDQTDCGVACLLSLIKYYEGDGSLEKLRELSGTNRQGTTLLGLYQAANQLGFDAQGCEANIQAIIDHRTPLILHVLIDERLEHYIICYRYENGKFVIGDPAKGIYELSAKELEAIWVSRTCLTLAPNDEFVKAKAIARSKKVWFLTLLKEDYKLLGISIGIGVTMAVLGTSMAIFSQKLIDDILPSNDLKRLLTGLALLSFLLMARVGFSTLRELFLIRQSKDFNNRIIDKFYDSLLRLPKAFFDTRKIGELVARLNDTNRIQRVIKFLASNLLIDILSAIVALSFLYYYSWKIGLIATINLPIYFLIIYGFNSKIITAQKEVMQGYASSESHYINSMQGIASIKNHNGLNIFKKLNQLIYGNFQQKVFDLGKIKIRLSLFSGIAGVLFLIAVLGFGSYQVYQQAMSLGELMAVLGMAGTLMPAITNLALVAIPINEAKIAFQRMFEFASMQQEVTDGTHIEKFDSLEISDLTFRFAGRSRLLKGVNMKVHKGECVAIVGESGSGKSTLGQLLQKFYQKESGNIIVNGKMDLDGIAMESWRNHIGVVSQDIHLFNGTVLDNILMGTEDSVENVVKFVQQHGFEPFFSQFPQGLGTIVGEEGINLSGGQRQVVALARVLYKRPQLLILDEATAAMDRNTEKFTLRLLERLKDELTVILISHRLHTLKNFADRIYVLEDGKVAHGGGHKELLLTHNFYSEFWQELNADKKPTLVSA
ncbi:peptidase domain-containing ABC transporter [Sungkyunkwania multivorans]|uniref:Peptidase domain-containing ABC transporter n=1 Tax=Sungkyunkwania multivorans TaxID=1173618 RepID=A0ABW3D0P3_9FLAO